MKLKLKDLAFRENDDGTRDMLIKLPTGGGLELTDIKFTDHGFGVSPGAPEILGPDGKPASVRIEQVPVRFVK